MNRYVVNHLIDWDNVPNDPIFQLTFPQPGMLEDADVDKMCGLVRNGATSKSSRNTPGRFSCA